MNIQELEALVLSQQKQIESLTAWATSEIAKRDAKIREQAAYIEQLENKIVVLEKKIVCLEQTIVDLNARLKSNSKNSSKPPSSDGLNKPAPRSLRAKSGKNPGGQTGHKGSGLKMKATIDHQVPCWPSQCTNCAHRTSCSFKIHERRSVMDIVVKLERTEYQQMEVHCPLSGSERLIGDFPSHVTGSKQYGQTLRSFSAAMVMECAVSYDKTSRFIRDLTSCTLSRGTIANTIAMCKAKLESPMEYLRQAILSSAVVNFDETGLRVDGRLNYVHNASTPTITYQTISKSRGVAGMNEGKVLPHYRGTAVHDCWAPY